MGRRGSAERLLIWALLAVLTIVTVFWGFVSDISVPSPEVQGGMEGFISLMVVLGRVVVLLWLMSFSPLGVIGIAIVIGLKGFGLGVALRSAGFMALLPQLGGMGTNLYLAYRCIQLALGTEHNYTLAAHIRTLVYCMVLTLVISGIGAGYY